jgi:hypothetical protein
MTELTWQKSSFSEAGGANCLYLAAAAPAGPVHLCESDRPGTVLTTTPTALAHLLDGIRGPVNRPLGRQGHPEALRTDPAPHGKRQNRPAAPLRGGAAGPGGHRGPATGITMEA